MINSVISEKIRPELITTSYYLKDLFDKEVGFINKIAISEQKYFKDMLIIIIPIIVVVVFHSF